MAKEEKIILNPYFSDNFNRILKRTKTKDKKIFQRIKESVDKIINNPLCGKPLRNLLKGFRRVHIGSFVLVYEITSTEVRFIDFEHHDKVYKKKYDEFR
jgi:YafQ family addiction module toxin component